MVKMVEICFGKRQKASLVWSSRKPPAGGSLDRPRIIKVLNVSLWGKFRLNCMPQWCITYEGVGNTANYMYQIECMFNANPHRTSGKPLSWDAIGLPEKI